MNCKTHKAPKAKSSSKATKMKQKKAKKNAY